MRDDRGYHSNILVLWGLDSWAYSVLTEYQYHMNVGDLIMMYGHGHSLNNCIYHIQPLKQLQWNLYEFTIKGVFRCISKQVVFPDSDNRCDFVNEMRKFLFML